MINYENYTYIQMTKKRWPFRKIDNESQVIIATPEQTIVGRVATEQEAKQISEDICAWLLDWANTDSDAQ